MRQGIYKIHFPDTGYFYIGSSSKSLKTRWGTHLYHMKRGTHYNSIMQRCYEKYGEPIFEIIEEVKRWNCPVFKELLLSREQYYIDSLSPTINLAPRAGSGLGSKRTEEALVNMRGRVPSVETRTKISQSLRNQRPYSEERRRKMSASKKGKPATNRKLSRREIAQIKGLNMECITISQLSRAYKLSRKGIRLILKNKQYIV